MNHIIPAEFHGTPLNIIDHAGRKWLTANQVGRCLGYSEANASDGVNRLCARHMDEFGDADTCTVKLTVQGQGRETRIFSDTGCQLLGFFANTEKAKAFRAWAKQVLASEATAVSVVHVPASPAAIDVRLDRVIGLLETLVQALVETLPVLLKSASGKGPRRKAKEMYVADRDQIAALRQSGASLEEIMAATGFSQTQVSYVLTEQVHVKPDGRVVLVHRARTAMQGRDLFGNAGGAA